MSALAELFIDAAARHATPRTGAQFNALALFWRWRARSWSPGLEGRGLA